MGKMISNINHPNFLNYKSPKLQAPNSDIPDLPLLNCLVQEKAYKNQAIFLNNFQSKSNFKHYKLKNVKELPQKCQKLIDHTNYLTSNITILTYNVWFENHNWENRLASIFKMIGDSDADFVCLQQVTKDFIEKLQKQPFLKKYKTKVYDMKNWYDTIILSKFQCRTVKKMFKQTNMSRSMLLSQLILANGQNIIVGCMHYESLNNQKIRMSQLLQTFEACEKCPNVIIAGDFNFSDAFPENKLIFKNGFKDLWIQKYGTDQKQIVNMDKGFTMPQTQRFPKWRPDHIIARSLTGISSHQIERIGSFTIPPFQKQKMENIMKDGVVRTPSDHLGLITKISMKFTR